MAFPWHEYSTVNGVAYNDPPTLFTGNENGYVNDVAEGSNFGNTLLTSDPMGVGLPQHWYVLGRYYVRALVFRYVESGLDGSTFQEYYFDVTPNEGRRRNCTDRPTP